MFSSTELHHSPDCSVVLWGEYFDETAAVIFTSALRQEGVGVKLVGLAGSTATGIHRLVLNADLTLGEALDLPMRATCLIIPCSGGILRRCANDPRLLHFLAQICQSSTRLILKEPDTLEPTTLAHLSITPDNLAIYSASDDLIKFAHHTAQTLASEMWAI